MLAGIVKRFSQLGQGWFDRRSVGMGTSCGVLGGLCCIGKAVAVGAGLGASSFFVAWMDRYQLYFVVGSLGLLTIWLVGMIRSYGLTTTGLLTAGRSSVRHALVCGGTYVVTLGLTMGVMALADWLWSGH